MSWALICCDENTWVHMGAGTINVYLGDGLGGPTVAGVACGRDWRSCWGVYTPWLGAAGSCSRGRCCARAVEQYGSRSPCGLAGDGSDEGRYMRGSERCGALRLRRVVHG